MPSESNACPVCRWQLNRSPRSSGDADRFDCPRCGTFIFSRSALEDLPSVLRTDKQRAVLSYWIRRSTPIANPAAFHSTQIERIIRLGSLPTAIEQADNLIRWIGDTAEGPGAAIVLNGRDHGAIAGSLLNLESFSYLVSEIVKSGELVANQQDFTFDNTAGGTTRHAGGAARANLSLNGWRRYEELKKGAISSNVAFMAMQYGDSDMDGIVNEHFRPAVAQTGFTLRRLDDEPRAGLIDDRLRVEIRGCRLLIADLTHGNRGAHWEAGYAEGLSKPVIYTCRNDVFSDVNHVHHPHFDTNHHLTVPWDPDDIEDAEQRLKDTIRATIPEAKQED